MATWDLKLVLAVGAMFLALLTTKILQFIILYLRPSSIGRYRHSVGGKPPWALVTGASDGIGRSLARELANRGFNVIIHGRNPAKLERVKAGILEDFPERSVRIVIVDAAVYGPKMVGQIDKLAESIQDLNLTVLINNAGGVPAHVPRLETFDETTTSTIDAITSVNLQLPIHLTSALLPTLLKHQPSLIITIGSMADMGSPWISLYSGSKAFLMSWCKALAREMKAERRDVEVLGILTARVTSVSFSKEPASLLLPDAPTYAKAVLDKVGCGQVIVNGYWVQGIMKAVVGYMPEWLFSRILVNSTREELLREKYSDEGVKKD